MDDKDETRAEDIKSEDAASAPAIAAAEPAAVVVAKPKKKSKRNPVDLSPLDIAGGVFFLVILSLLVGNCYIAYLGQAYNQRICSEAIGFAGDAANKGMDTPSLIIASYKSWEDCPPPGFFIEHPEFTSFKDEITPELRVITIATKTKVRFPAQFLIFDRSALDKEDDEAFPHKTFNISYQYRLSNPGNIENKIIRGKDGHLMTVPMKGGNAAAAKGAAKVPAKAPAQAPAKDDKK